MPRTALVFLMSVFFSSGSLALSLGPDEFAAAERLTCVLAQQSLGYLNDEEYADMAGQVLDEYAQEASDVIYAKALGYYHGLMFGINDGDESQVSSRTLSFLNSQACTTTASVNLGLLL